MKMSNRLLVVVVCLVASGAAALYHAQTSMSGPDVLMATANNFLASLTPEQAAKAKFEFNDDERFNWHFIPKERKGLPFKEMKPFQRELAHATMAAALSQRGMIKATSIMSLEQVLAELEKGGRIQRDPELYFFTIFGQPSTTSTWGWRIEGHHLAVNVTFDKGQIIASTPTFMGANPAEVKEGPRKGLRVLAREEDLARQLLESLDPAQKKTAIIETKAPDDIITAASRKAEIGAPVGLAASKLNQKQKDTLISLLEEYAGRMAPDTAMTTMNDVRRNGIEKITFAWAGGEKRGEKHYYRVQGPTFLIEYDNTQNDANHIHSVWRDLKNDFGVDILRQHYKTDHGI